MKKMNMFISLELNLNLKISSKEVSLLYLIHIERLENFIVSSEFLVESVKSEFQADVFEKYFNLKKYARKFHPKMELSKKQKVPRRLKFDKNAKDYLKSLAELRFLRNHIYCRLPLI